MLHYFLRINFRTIAPYSEPMPSNYHITATTTIDNNPLLFIAAIVSTTTCMYFNHYIYNTTSNLDIISKNNSFSRKTNEKLSVEKLNYHIPSHIIKIYISRIHL